MVGGQSNIKYRVNTVAASFIFALAFIGDLVQGFLTLTVVFAIASPIVTFLVDTALIIWFVLLRINFIGGKKALSRLGAVMTSTVIETIPLIGGLPSLTIMAAYVIHSARSEDRANPKRQQRTVKPAPPSRPVQYQENREAA